jgi:hypothetical protein
VFDNGANKGAKVKIYCQEQVGKQQLLGLILEHELLRKNTAETLLELKLIRSILKSQKKE